jgi:O-antigen/teichoic acid export membrane protein
VWLLASAGIVSVGGFLYWKQATTQATPEIIAPVLALNGLIGILSILGALGFPEIVIRYRNQINLYKVKIWFKMLTASLLAILLCSFFAVQLLAPNVTFHSWLRPILLTILIAIPATFSSYFDSANIANQHSRNVLFASIASVAVKLGFIVSPIEKSSVNLLLNISLAATVYLLVSAGGFLLSKRIESVSKDSEKLSSLLGYSSVNVISSATSQLTVSILPFIILTRSGASSSATASFLFVLMAAISTPNAVFSKLFLSESSNSPEKFNAILKSRFTQSLVLTVSGVLVLELVADQLMGLFGNVYRELGAGPLRILGAASVVAISNYFIDSYLNFRKARVAYLSVNIFGSFILLVFTWEFSQFGLLSMAMGWLLAQVVYTLFGLLMIRRFAKGRISDQLELA